jgi:Ca2+/Na+ antiporter
MEPEVPVACGEVAVVLTVEARERAFPHIVSRKTRRLAPFLVASVAVWIWATALTDSRVLWLSCAVVVAALTLVPFLLWSASIAKRPRQSAEELDAMYERHVVSHPGRGYLAACIAGWYAIVAVVAMPDTQVSLGSSPVSLRGSSWALSSRG